MCRRTTCRTCQKITYAGCGMHVDQVLAGVRAADRCACTKGEKGGPGVGGRRFWQLFSRG